MDARRKHPYICFYPLRWCTPSSFENVSIHEPPEKHVSVTRINFFNQPFTPVGGGALGARAPPLSSAPVGGVIGLLAVTSLWM